MPTATTLPRDPLSEFFSDVPDLGPVSSLFDHIPGVCFFVKDRESRLVHGNQLLLQQLGVESLSEFIGTLDKDFYPPEYCKSFIKDDQLVFTTGLPLIDRVELGYNGPYVLDWFITTKWPVIDEKGWVKGLTGVTRICDDKSLHLPSTTQDGFCDLLKWLKTNNERQVTPDEMAKIAGMSVWQLRNRFQETFGTTPKAYELTNRIQSASKALAETTSSIADIAIDFGFCDQSAFTNQFKKRIGLSPGEFRTKKA